MAAEAALNEKRPDILFEKISAFRLRTCLEHCQQQHDRDTFTHEIIVSQGLGARGWRLGARIFAWYGIWYGDHQSNCDAQARSS